MNLSATDVYLQAIWETDFGEGPSIEKIWAETDQSQIRSVFRALGAAIPDAKVVYVGKPSEYCGAALIDTRRALDRAIELLHFDGDDMWLFRSDLSNALLLEYIEDYVDPVDPRSRKTMQYRMQVAGKDWVEYEKHAI